MSFSLSKICSVAAGALFMLGVGAMPATAQPDTAAEAAETQVGGTYAWGGNGPNAFDCSGLIAWAYAQAGVDTLPRTSAAMYQHTTSISRSQLQTGDLVFYSYGRGVSHVALYVGDGEIVHARNSRMGIRKDTLGAMHNTPVGYGRVPGVSQTSASRSVSNATTNNPGSSTTTRAQAARIVADELNLGDRRNPFGVRTEAGAVGAVHHARIAFPYADGLFRPNVPITDRQINVWLGRANLSASQETRIRTAIGS